MEIWKWFKQLNRNWVPSPEPSVMRTVIPELNTNALKIIEYNAKNALEDINYELGKITIRLAELHNKRKKYERILEAVKDDKYFDEKAIRKWRAENGVVG